MIHYAIAATVPYLGRGYSNPRLSPVNSPSLSPDESRRREDIDLLQRIGQRDEKALRELYDRFSPGLFAVALRILNDQRDAEEVLQECFCQIWRHAPAYDSSLSSGFSWAAMIVWHKAIDRLRARSRFERTADRARDLDCSAVMDETSAFLPFAAERRNEVRSALAKLPEDQSESLTLAYFGGLTQQQIAERLGEPLGTIKARIRRALLRLRELLKEAS
jgi:RNA polymerase sigma-70 factor (ECF subfamily)